MRSCYPAGEGGRKPARAAGRSSACLGPCARLPGRPPIRGFSASERRRRVPARSAPGCAAGRKLCEARRPAGMSPWAISARSARRAVLPLGDSHRRPAGGTDSALRHVANYPLRGFRPCRIAQAAAHRAAISGLAYPNVLCPSATQHAAATAPQARHLSHLTCSAPAGHNMPLPTAPQPRRLPNLTFSARRVTPCRCPPRCNLDAARLHRLRPAGHGRPLRPRRRAAVIPSRRCGSSPRHLRFPRSGTTRPPAPSAGSPSPPRSSPLRRPWR